MHACCQAAGCLCAAARLLYCCRAALVAAGGGCLRAQRGGEGKQQCVCTKATGVYGLQGHCRTVKAHMKVLVGPFRNCFGVMGWINTFLHPLARLAAQTIP